MDKTSNVSEDSDSTTDSDEESVKEQQVEKKVEEEIEEKVEEKAEEKAGEKVEAKVKENDADTVGEENVEDEEEIFYDPAEFISGPFLSRKCTMPENILEFHFSFGFNCRKFSNLVNPDTNNLVFVSGNFINIFNVETKQLSFRRTASGGGVGSIKINPNPIYQHLAIAENSYRLREPILIIYEWPDFKIIRVLKGSASNYFNYIDYSLDGVLLASQSGQPDCLITIWKWRENKIILRVKSHLNDVYKIKISNYYRGDLVTCGDNHIKFWHVYRTFTGIKLYDKIGKFDKTKSTSIIGVFPMPDGTVLSGCSWGTILLWENGLIKFEICQTNNRPCHKLPIIQFYFNQKTNELWTISMDGHIKFWWYRTIEQTENLTGSKQIIEIEPSYDFYIPKAMFMCVRKRYSDNEQDTTYFAQDGNGGIWLLDLKKEISLQAPPVQLYKCHGGRIMDIAACPWGPYLISIGEDGKLILYQYKEKSKIFYHQFLSKATCILWFNSNLSQTGDELILGFDDGALRICILTIEKWRSDLTIVQIIKPHKAAIMKIIINKDDTILITASEDSTIFLFQLKYDDYPRLIAIGFVTLPSPATYLMWHNLKINSIIIGCLRGEIVEFDITDNIINIHSIKRASFNLNHIKLKISKFTSCKSQIRRNKQILELKERKIDELKRKSLYFDDSDSEISIDEEQLEPLYIPKIPNKILWMQIIERDRDRQRDRDHDDDEDEEGEEEDYNVGDLIVLSMGGYDSGYLYQYKIDDIAPEPYKYHIIPHADDIEIYTFVYNYNKQYLIFAMQSGEIRINKLKDANLNDLSNYWELSLHDSNNCIPKICFSYNEHYLFTCGYDDNLFALKFNPEKSDYIPEKFIKKIKPRKHYPKPLEDQPLHSNLTIEEESLKTEQDRIDKLSDNRKMLFEKLEILTERYLIVKERNLGLLDNQFVSLPVLVIDKRVCDYIDKKFEQELESIKEQKDYELEKSQVRVRKLKDYLLDCLDVYPITVKAFNKILYVQCLTTRKLSNQHYDYLNMVEAKIAERERKYEAEIRRSTDSKGEASTILSSDLKQESTESFLTDLSQSTIESCLGNQFNRALNKYRCRKKKWKNRQEQWNQFLATKPSKNANAAENQAILERAKETIGYFKLKSSSDYNISSKSVYKYREILQANEKLYDMKHNFNLKVYKLRDSKIKLYQQLVDLTVKMREIQQDLDERDHSEIPKIEKLEDYECPEKYFEINIKLDISEKQKVIENDMKILPQLDFDSYERQILENCKNETITNKRNILDLDFDQLLQLSSNNQLNTNWELELYQKRYKRKIIEQREIIAKINQKINEFNSELIELNEESVRVEINSLIVNHFILTLNQELIVLRDYELLKASLRYTIAEKQKELLLTKDLINISNENIQKHQQEHDKLMEMNRNIYQEYLQTVQDSPNFAIFQEVFESGKKQDTEICPDELDQSICDLILSLRTKRNEIEAQIQEKSATIRLLKENIANYNEQLANLEEFLNKLQEDLLRSKREKREKLNEIKTVVILQLSQIVNLDESLQANSILESLVFSKQRLTKLYKRVDELQVETDDLKKAHLPKIHHLRRISADIKFMEANLQQLKYEMDELVGKQFGTTVNVRQIQKNLLMKNFDKDILTELEEIVLKKYVHDLQLSERDLSKIYTKEVNLWKDNVKSIQNELKETLEENTRRQELLKMLLKEKYVLGKFLEVQNKKQEHLTYVESNMKENRKEIEKLQRIVEQQNNEIFELKDEIKQLRTKGVLPKRIVREELPTIPKEPSEEFVLYEESIEEEERAEIESEAEEEGGFRGFRISSTVEGIVRNLLNEMWENLNIQLNRRSQENFMRAILDNIFQRFSVHEMLNELIDNLPVEIPEEKVQLLEITAEKLMTLSDTQLDEDGDVEKYCSEILEDLLDDIILMKEGPNAMIASFVNRLIDQLPIDFIKKDTSMEMITERFIELSINKDIDINDVESRINHTIGCEIIKEILENVYQKIGI